MAERNQETHPAFGMIRANRIQGGPPGASLFDSEIRHQHYVIVEIAHAARKRDLNRDWIYSRDEIIQVSMSEAQWAAFVSSMGTSGVPCTLSRLDREQIDEPPYAPRLQQSLNETRDAADRAFDDIKEAFATYQASPTKANLRTLQARIENATPNVVFAGESLAGHAENVVEKARADLEAIVARQAAALGAGDMVPPALLGPGGDDAEVT